MVDLDELNQARIETRLLEWMRAGRLLYKAEATGNQPITPSDIIHAAEHPDLAYAIEQAREPQEDTDGYLVGWTGRSSDIARDIWEDWA